MRRLFEPITGGALILLILAIAVVSCGPSPEHNVDVLSALPEMPGAQQLHLGSVPIYGAEGPLGRQVTGHETRALYEAGPGVTAQQVIDFFVSELKDDWCYKTSQSYAYENGEFVDGQSLEVTFQGHGSTMLLTTHHMLSGGQAFRLAVGPTYEKDPDIDFCEH